MFMPLNGIWMPVTCPGAGVYNPDGRRSHLLQQLTVWTSVLASQYILVRPFSVVALLA